MSTPRVLVLGGNFGGLTAALAVKHELGDDVDVTVVSASDRFLFTPSLIWVPFGKREPEQITFPLAPTFEANGVQFVHAEATAIDLDGRKVTAGGTVHGYDQLVIATGYRNDDDVVPGLEHAQGITTLARALAARTAWQRYLDDPGDVVVAATQRAGCFGAAYEFLFNLSHQLGRAGLAKDVRLTYVSAEPFLGHFGIGGLEHGEQLLGMFTRHAGIDVRLEATLDHVDEGRVVLTDGEAIETSFPVVVPPFLGQQVVADCTELADEAGNVRVRDTLQSVTRDEVYAVGAAAAVAAPWETAVPVGVPKTGFPTERQAHTAAANVVATIRGEPADHEQPFGDVPAVCVMDAGNNGVLILADRMLPPRRHSVLVPGPQSHMLKVAFEKYFLWKTRHGYVHLP